MSRVRVKDTAGSWAYTAGTSGTVVVPTLRRVIGIAAHATIAGSVTINGGDPIVIPAGLAVAIEPVGNIMGPTIVFTDTDSFVVETVN